MNIFHYFEILSHMVIYGEKAYCKNLYITTSLVQVSDREIFLSKKKFFFHNISSNECNLLKPVQNTFKRKPN